MAVRKKAIVHYPFWFFPRKEALPTIIIIIKVQISLLYHNQTLMCDQLLGAVRVSVRKSI